MTMRDMYKSQYVEALAKRDAAKKGSDERALAQVELNDCRAAIKRVNKAGWNISL